VRVIAQICLGLQRAHQLGLIHRDVKPHNILVRGDGVAKLADLGLVKDVNAEMALTRPGVGFGTLHFMAPEQHVSATSVDHRCDIFALGATLYMMVTGESPYGQDYAPLSILENKKHNRIVSPRLIVPEISEHLDWAIRRAMRADPAQRPASCREFLEDLTGRSRRFVEERSEDRWYLRYRDAQGNECLARHSTATARQCLERGLLGNLATVMVSANADGPFVPLGQLAEFRDLTAAPPPR
jgi:serine/threonine protein kinase